VGGLWRTVARQLRLKPLETLAGLGGALGGLWGTLAGLGFLALRDRESLIGLHPLTYPHEHLLSTGADALGSLLWRGLWAFTAPHPGLQVSALALLALLAVLWAAGRFARRSPAARLAALVLTALFALLGAWLYSVALHSSLEEPAPRQALRCAGHLSRTLPDRAAFETCSWLVNGSEMNNERRRGLAGLLGWILLLTLGSLWIGIRLRGLGRTQSRLRWGVVGAHALIAIFLFRLWPLAHAYAEWGVSYPPVQFMDSDGCASEIARAVAAGQCCAFDVSEGAQAPVLLLWGDGCPRGQGIVGAEGSCVIRQEQRQPINSRCL
jgi:hypothetical protein